MRERRFKKARTPRRVFLVICEGDTERTYIETLKNHYRLPVAIKTKVSGNNINSRLVNQYLHELGLEKEDEYKIFYVYDADVKCVAEKLFNLNGTVILTNPCIELWYLLHINSHCQSLDSKSIVKALSISHPAWTLYAKGNLSLQQQSMLITHRYDAANRAKKLQWPDNPSSNLHIFIEALDEEKKG